MAQRTIIEYFDDLDGSKAEGSVYFGLDGKEYVIDLSEKNAAKFRAVLEPYIKVARKATIGTRKPVRKVNLNAATPVIRAWAASQGIKLSSRGRIPADVIKAYDEAHL
ncbi:MAG: Lsr2 family protein [Propionibacteriaceae bacterium]|jgi:hypothetical protein|nr:Lsr2 family protein [Propionibacteriaceae bacterium]